MAHPIAYCDPLQSRRQDVHEHLLKAGRKLLVAESLTNIPPQAELVLVGVEDLKAALPMLAWLCQEKPQRQVLLLWSGSDQDLLIQAMRSGVRDVIASPPAAEEAISRALGRLASEAQHATERPGRLIAMFSLKGGIGKSMLASNLAIAMYRMSRQPTMLIDLSLPCGNLEMYLDLHPTRSVSDVLQAGKEIDHGMVQQALARHYSGISLLAGPRAGQQEAVCRNSSQPMLELLMASPGVVLADIGSYVEEAQVVALEMADLVLVPVSPLISSVGIMPQTREYLHELGVAVDRILPVLNHAAPDDEDVPDDVIAKLLGEKPRFELPWGGGEITASLNAGQPIAHHRPKTPMGQAVEALARECLLRVDLFKPEETPEKQAFNALTWLKSVFPQKGVAHVRT